MDFTITQIDENGVVLARQPNRDQWLGQTMMNNSLFQRNPFSKKRRD